jgi:hypothetical protein
MISVGITFWSAVIGGLGIYVETTHKRTLTSNFLFPHFCRSFIFSLHEMSPIFELKEALYVQAMPPNAHASVRRTRSISGGDQRRKRTPAASEATDCNHLQNVGQGRVSIGADLAPTM